MTLSFGTVLSIAFYISNRNNTPDQRNDLIVHQDTTITTIFDMKPEEPVKQEQAAEAPAAAETEVTDITSVNVVDTASVETHTTLNAMADPNLLAVSGTSATGTGEPGTAGGNGTLAIADGSGSIPEIAETFSVDREPEFEGGLAALYKFINNNIRYPSLAAELGKQGTVYVKFVVSERGKVEKVMLQNNLGYGLDDEAKRVVSIIPDFKSPASVKGHPVKVYYQLPIRFKLR